MYYAATALIYNVREFRKVGGEFRKIGSEFRKIGDEFGKIGRHLDELSEGHMRFRKEMAAEHREIVTVRSLIAQISKSGR